MFLGLDELTLELDKRRRPFVSIPTFGTWEDPDTGEAWKLGVLSVNTTDEGVCLILGEMQPPLPPEGKA